MESSKKSKVVDLAEERRRRSIGSIAYTRIDSVSIDKAMAYHPAGRNRQPVDFSLGDDEIVELAEFIKTKEIQRAGGAVIEVILNDENDASSDQLIHGPGQDS